MILVTGATGTVGRPLVADLVARGADVRALARDPSRAHLPVPVVRGDLSRAGSLAPALDGVDTVFLLWRQDAATDHRRAVEAIAGRASRIVYLSSLSVRDDLERQPHPMSAIHADLEAAIRASGLTWTFLRAGTFASNALGWADEIRATGAVRLPYPEAGRSPVDPADLSRAAAAVLTGEGHDGRTYVPTGPEPLTEADEVRVLGEAIGRPIRVEAVTPAAARTALIADGADEELADAALAYRERLVVHPEPVTEDVERLTGRPATTFRAWARAHAEAFRSPERPPST